MKKLKYECIKGIATSEGHDVVIMQGDIVKVLETNEGEVLVEGVDGWCEEMELSFTPREFVEHFRTIL